MPNVDARMEYVGNAAPGFLAGDLPDSGMSFALVDGTNYPTGAVGQFTVVVNKGGATEEKILCSNRVNTEFTVAANGRGFDGTLPQTHSAGESVQVCWTAYAADKDNAHNSAVAGVHGVAGNVVGTTDIQTLSGKTIDGGVNTLLNIPETSVAGLVAALQALTGSESTDASNIVANASAITTLQGQVAAGRGLLAWKRSNVTGVSKSSSGGGLTPIDATGATVTFTGPTTGNVIVRITADMSGVNAGYLGATVHGGSTIVAGIRDLMGSSASPGRFTTEIPVTGLTPGSSYSYDAAGGCDLSNGCTFGNAMISVWAAP
jgi:hypothetical protein